MAKFKELSALGKIEIDKKLKELNLELIKAKVTAKKGGKVKLREIKKIIARLLMLKSQKSKSGVEKKA